MRELEKKNINLKHGKVHRRQHLNILCCRDGKSDEEKKNINNYRDECASE